MQSLSRILSIFRNNILFERPCTCSPHKRIILVFSQNQEERDGPTEEDDDDIDLADQVHQPGSPAPGVETETGALPTAEATPAPPALLPTPAEVSATQTSATTTASATPTTTCTPTTTATNTTIATPTTNATPTTTTTLTITATPTTTTASGSGQFLCIFV